MSRAGGQLRAWCSRHLSPHDSAVYGDYGYSLLSRSSASSRAAQGQLFSQGVIVYDSLPDLRPRLIPNQDPRQPFSWPAYRLMRE